MKTNMLRIVPTIIIALTCAGPHARAAAPELWFRVGEELIYTISWGVIPVGTSHVTTEWIEEDGERLLRIRFRNKSNAFLSTFYPVDDTLESVIDPETFLPRRFVKILNEGNYHCDEVTTFDFDEGVARWHSRRNDGRKEYPIKKDTRDLISFMYSMRRRALEPGETIEARVMADEKVYDLTVHALKKERVRLPNHGTVRSLKLLPEASFQGLFVRKGRMWMWVSDDDRRICTKLAVEVPVAKVKLHLTEVKGPGKDRWTRPPKQEEESDEWMY